MAEEQSPGRRYRWWCAYCDADSAEAFDSQRAAYEAGLAHIDASDHGLTTILTQEADDGG